MKITPNTGPAITDTVVRTETSVAAAYSASATLKDAASSQVAVSSAARQLFALQDESKDIDLARVEAIRTAIASGEFKINASHIADGWIDSVKELLA